MATTGLDVFDRSVQKSNQDRLTIDEAAQLAAQLTHLLRGVFYEGWDPSGKPETYRDRDTFLSRLAERAQLAGPAEASVAAVAATEVMRAHLAFGEVEDVLSILPSAIRTVLQPAERA